MQYINLKRQYQALKDEIDKNISQVIEDSEFILGSKVGLLEAKLAEAVGTKYAITCGNGTDALQLIYMAYGIGPGDAVFCPDMTFIASIEPACLLGATPVFCDIDISSYNIDVNSLKRQIEAVIHEGKLVPRAIVAVDFLGNPAAHDEIRLVAEKYNLLIIEDAAQAMGSKYKGRPCGSLGDIAATSFFPSKPLGCYGDGGAVFTNDDGIAELLCSLRVHGKGTTKYDNIHIGMNSRLDTIQAAVLLPKLDVLSNEIEERQIKARKYDEKLRDIVVVPSVSENNISAFAQYVIMVDSTEIREELQRRLKELDIPTIRYYPNPMHALPVFGDINSYGEGFYNSSKYADNSLGIPFSPYLDEQEQNFVIESIRSILG